MKLHTKIVEKVWGVQALPSPFHNSSDQPVGEIWFEPPAELPRILVKYLFTSEKLSVQVHPSDAQAPKGYRGKEECWLILHAEPGATLAIGFKNDISREQMRVAALDGSIEDALEWHPVQAGDFFYLPAGTVHAIGPGLTLVEVQQNSDMTYRLFDYGRPRELHLDEGIAVARGTAYPSNCHHKTAVGQSETLVNGPFFRFSQVAGMPDPALCTRHGGPILALPLDGLVVIDGDAIEAGECGLAQSINDVDFAKARRTLIISGA